MLVTTTDSIEGFKIINYLSIVTVNIYILKCEKALTLI